MICNAIGSGETAWTAHLWPLHTLLCSQQSVTAVMASSKQADYGVLMYGTVKL